MSVLGKRLKLSRQNKKLTQIDAANMLGISNGTLSGYERNYRDPDTTTLEKMAELYDVNVDYLLGRSDDPSPRNIHNKELAADSGYSIAFLGGAKEVLDEEEAAHLEKELEMFRAFKEKRRREREKKE